MRRKQQHTRRNANLLVKAGNSILIFFKLPAAPYLVNPISPGLIGLARHLLDWKRWHELSGQCFIRAYLVEPISLLQWRRNSA